KHATAIFPEALRWLWRDYPKPVTANPEKKSKQPILDILIPGEDWQLVGEGYRFAEGPAVNAKGEVFFTDIPNNRIHKSISMGESLYSKKIPELPMGLCLARAENCTPVRMAGNVLWPTIQTGRKRLSQKTCPQTTWQ